MARKIKEWTRDEELFLKNNIDLYTNKEFAKILNRTNKSVSNKKYSINAELPYKKQTRLYRIFASMKTRCINPKNKGYKNYGERGIAICEEWLSNFHIFEKWSISNGYQENLSIDRIDVNGNYSPQNCRWCSKTEQANNMRSNVFISAFGEIKTIAQWSVDNRCVIPYSTLYRRLRRKWDSELAIITPSLGTVKI